MKLIAALLGMFITGFGGLCIGLNTVPVTDEPKQSPYAIFIEVCGRVEYVIVTLDPPLGENARQEASPEMMKALQSVPREHAIILKHWDSFCPADPTQS